MYTAPKKIWIGFSGGVDSRVLLELIWLVFNNNPNYLLNVVHINHGINKQADSWELACQVVCQQLNINFQAVKLDADYDSCNRLQSNLEAELRAARMSVWQRLVSINDVLLLAHNLNDQAETLLLRLCRGAGVTGLAAIKPITNIGNIKIIRPLLGYTREQIQAFARLHQLQYIQDDSNFNTKFARNFVRHNILPVLAEFWPAAVVNISRAANHLQQAASYIERQAQEYLASCCGYQNYCNSQYNSRHNQKFLLIDKLLKHDYILQVQILRQFIMSKNFYPPSEAQLNRIYQEIIGAKMDRQPQLQIGDYIVTRYRNRLYVYAEQYWINNSGNLGWANKLGGLTVYFGRAANMVGLRQAKKIFQQLGIPAWQRYDYPLIFNDGKLVTILGLWSREL